MPQILPAFKDFLEKRGLKLTAQREKIMRFLRESGKHLSPEEIFHALRREDSNLGRATVFRTLRLLSEGGLVSPVTFADGRHRFESCVGRHHHDHMICESCGAAIEFSSPALERLQDKIAKRRGFTIKWHRHEIFGVCRQCRKAAPGRKLKKTRAAVFAAGVLAAGILPAAATEAECSRAVYAMGSLLKINVTVTSKDACEPLSQMIVDEVNHWDRNLSPAKSDSEIARVNRAAPDPIAVSRRTLALVHQSLAWSEKTGGAFDPTAAPLVSLWGFDTPTPRIPDEFDIEKTKALVGWRNVEITDRPPALRLARRGMQLDLDGIERGWALDAAVKAVQSDPALASVLMIFGGRTVFWSRQPVAWPANIHGLSDPDGTPTRLVVRQNGALSTASAGERVIVARDPKDFDTHGQPMRYARILDPATGRPAEGSESVTVWSPKAADADALSNAIFIMGPEKGLAWAETNNVAASIIYLDGQGISARETSQWKKTFKDN